MADDKSVKNSKITQGPTLSTQTYLRIAEIRDNTLVLKNDGIRAVLRVNSINFNLKSEDEQNAIIYSYQGFLNTLEDPIQIVVRSKKLDVDHYLDTLKDISNKQQNPLLKKTTVDYIDYIQKLVEYADIMEKQFYVIVPQESARGTEMGFLTKFLSFINSKDSYSEIKARRKEFSSLRKKLSQKVATVKGGLEGCGLKVEELSTKELIHLFYETYNPSVSRFEKGDKLDESDLKTEEVIRAEDQGQNAENKQIQEAKAKQAQKKKSTTKAKSK